MELLFKSGVPLGNIKIERDGKVLDVFVMGFTRNNEAIIEDTRKLPDSLRRLSYANSYYGRRVIELDTSSFKVLGEDHVKDCCVVRT